MITDLVNQNIVGLIPAGWELVAVVIKGIEEVLKGRKL